MRSLVLVLCLVSVATVPAKDVPAFPGAEGYGAKTPGGRGGKVIAVSNLNDSGSGSFRAACAAEGPRIVVFRVGGIIDLKSEINVTEPYLTVAVQTAPGDGICLRGFNFLVSTHDVIVRYLRSRPGIASGKEVDAIGVGSGGHDVIIDHCSATWAIDENLSPSGSISNITVQWCIIAEALNHSIHHKGPHGYGSLARAVGGVSLHHNLWAHNTARNPRLGDNYGRPPFPTFDCRNNVIYDYGDVASGLTGDRLDVNYVGNYIRPGPSSNRKRGVIVFTDTADAKYFVQGNIVDGNAAATKNNKLLFDRTEKDGKRLVSIEPTPFATPPIKTSNGKAALRDVLAHSGATLPIRDSVDRRIVQTVRDGSGKIIDRTDEVGGWPQYRSSEALLDSDGDGMPDDWEIKHHLNPHDPSDAVRDRDGDGYTNIEKYVNSIRAR